MRRTHQVGLPQCPCARALCAITGPGPGPCSSGSPTPPRTRVESAPSRRLAAGEQTEGEIVAKLPADLDGAVQINGRIIRQRHD